MDGARRLTMAIGDLENWDEVPEQVISQGFTTEWLDTTSPDAPQRLYKVGVEY